MRRRAWIALLVAAVLLLGIAVFALRTPGRSSDTRAERGERASAKVSRSDARVPTRNLAGTVFLDDVPAADATVRIVARRGGFHASRKTDARGQFDFGPVPIAAYRVIAEVPRATGTAIGLDLHDPLIDADKLRLIAHACDASLHGVVRDASGGVVGRARILVSDLFESGAGTGEGPGTEAGEDGTYELCVPVGNSVVLVQADGYAGALAPVSAFGPVRRDFELVPEAVVSGRAVRAHDGAPVAGAQLTLQVTMFAAEQHVPVVHAVSDADGRFRFRGVAPGTYVLSAKADHLRSAEPIEVEADLATPVENLECKLVPAYAIAGRVVENSPQASTTWSHDRSTGPPAPPAWLPAPRTSSFGFPRWA